MRNWQTATERFWAKVEKHGEDECWEWRGYSNGRYGQLHADGRKQYAHRYSYELHKGQIPEGLQIRHQCHNQLCVNPQHLDVGTMQDNSDDKVRARRQSYLYGESNPKVKLTDAQCLEMINKYKEEGIPHKQLATEYGVSRESIRQIINKERRAYLQE